MKIKGNLIFVLIVLLNNNYNYAQLEENGIMRTSITDSSISILIPLDFIPNLKVKIEKHNLPAGFKEIDNTERVVKTRNGDLEISMSMNLAQTYFKDSVKVKTKNGKEEFLPIEFFCSSKSKKIASFTEFLEERKKYIISNESEFQSYIVEGTNVVILLFGKRTVHFYLGGAIIMR